MAIKLQTIFERNKEFRTNNARYSGTGEHAMVWTQASQRALESDLINLDAAIDALIIGAGGVTSLGGASGVLTLGTGQGIGLAMAGTVLTPSLVLSTDVGNTLSFGTDGFLYTAAGASPGAATPLADATTGAVGTSGLYSRQDHIHPFSHSFAITATNTLNYTYNGNLITQLLPTDAVTGTLGAGHTIGTHTSVNGTAVIIRETVTSVATQAAGGFDFTNENGTVTNIPFRSVQAGNVLATGSDGGVYYNGAGIVTAAVWDDVNNEIDITFANAGTLSVPIVDAVANFLCTTTFTATSGANIVMRNGTTTNLLPATDSSVVLTTANSGVNHYTGFNTAALTTNKTPYWNDGGNAMAWGDYIAGGANGIEYNATTFNLELGGNPLLHNTTVTQATFDMLFTNTSGTLTTAMLNSTNFLGAGHMAGMYAQSSATNYRSIVSTGNGTISHSIQDTVAADPNGAYIFNSAASNTGGLYNSSAQYNSTAGDASEVKIAAGAGAASEQLLLYSQKQGSAAGQLYKVAQTYTGGIAKWEMYNDTTTPVQTVRFSNTDIISDAYPNTRADATAALNMLYTNATGTVMSKVYRKGTKVAIAAAPAGALNVTHNLNMPAGSFSNLVFECYDSTGDAIILKRTEGGDTANTIQFDIPVAITSNLPLVLQLVPTL